MVLRRSAATPPHTPGPSHRTMTLLMTFTSDSELRSLQERVEYAMIGGSEVVVGTSIASYDLMHASWCCGGPLPRPRSHLTLTSP